MKYFNGLTFSFLCLVGLTLTSCTMESNTHFSENYSGSQVVSIDMADMVELMSMFGGSESGEMDDMMNRFNAPEFADSLAMVEDSISAMFAGTGADNFSLAFSEEGVMSMGYDFASLETFQKMKNKSAELAQKSNMGNGQDQMSDMLSGMIGGNYSQKGKWLTIPLSAGGVFDDLKGDLPGGMDMGGDDMEETMEMMEGFMGGSITFKNVYTFDKQIKKIKSNIPYVQKDNKLIVEYSMSDMLKWGKEEKEAFVKLKLK